NIRRQAARGHAVEPGLELFASAAHSHDLCRMEQAEQGLHEMLDRADAKPSRRYKNCRAILLETMLATHGPLVFLFGEDRIDGNAGNSDLLSCDAELLQMCAGFVKGHEIVLEMMHEPHRMDVEIRNDDGLSRAYSLLGLEPGNDFGGDQPDAA